MVRIRLRKPGKVAKGRYHFKIVVIDLARARDARFIDELGHYDPSRQLLKVNVDKYASWVKRGAQPTQTVSSLVKRYQKAQDVKK